MTEVNTSKIKAFFTAGAKPKVSTEDHAVLRDLYLQAEQDDRVLACFLLSPTALLSAQKNGLTRAGMEEALYNEAKTRFPGIGATGQAIEEYFQITRAKPAIICDDDNKTALFVFPVDQEKNNFVAYVYTLSQIKTMYEAMADQNATQLKALRLDESDVKKGLTPDLIRAKREALEKTARVFEHITALRVKDNLRDAFRAVCYTEDGHFTQDAHRATIASLILDYMDPRADERPFSKHQLDKETLPKGTSGLGKTLLAERRATMGGFN